MSSRGYVRPAPRFTGEYYASAVENTAQAQPVGHGTPALALARRCVDHAR